MRVTTFLKTNRLDCIEFQCIFPSCNCKHDGIEKGRFLRHLRVAHHNETLEISKKENMPIKITEMTGLSN